MIRFFAIHPTAANLLMIFFMVLGATSLPEIKRETFPQINTFEVQVQVPYPGATPLDVELSICKPLEDAIDGISFIEEKRCEARNSLALMSVKMLEEGQFDKFLDDVKNAVDGINSFPKDAETATVQETGRTQDVVTVAMTADINRQELKTLAEQVKQRMLQTGEIPLVEIKGFSDRQFQVHVPQYNMRQYGLSLQDIANRIQKQNLDLPLGTVETSSRDYQIRFSDEKRTAHELSQLIIIQGEQGNEVRLGDIASTIDTFEIIEDKVTFNGKPAAFLTIRKNTRDDSLSILESIERFIEQEKLRLPQGVEFNLTQDYTSIVKDRIKMLLTNAWQGLILVFLVMWLFFGTRYSFWVVMGLPVSFLASAYILSHLGMSINMLTMVALLLALGILMDDAIVISESIGTHIKMGKSPMQAAVEGTQQVARGVFSSFLTTLCIFVGLIFLEGDLGQVLKVIPIVLISVIVVSLVEAFFILPHHLQHSLSHAKHNDKSAFRENFEHKFESFRLKIDSWVSVLVKFRYPFVGSVIAFLVVSISLMASGILKFSAFPNVEGDVVQARLLMPPGTSLHATEIVVDKLIKGLTDAEQDLDQLPGTLIKGMTVSYNQNADAFENGPHLATISADLLTAEQRSVSMNQLIRAWQNRVGELPEATNIAIKEPAIGPSGRAIFIRLQADDLQLLSNASYDLQQYLSGYPGVRNLLDDLRPGKPEFTLHLKQGAYGLGLDAQTIAGQIRAAYQGTTVIETNVGLETFEVNVKLDPTSRDDLNDFDTFPIIHPRTGQVVPLANVADIYPTRSYSRINRVNNQRTVSVYGDIDTEINNTAAIMRDLKQKYLAGFNERFPDVKINLEGEVKNSAKTQGSMGTAFLMGMVGIFVLLSFQFKSYIEPIIVMVNIPLALVGVIWGHMLMGLDITMPSMLGFVSLAGIVVNDSILLVEFVKLRVQEGLTVHEAAAKASHDRFRAVLLTSLTTIAGMAPLLFETSLQAQILIPLATSIVFGIASSTLLVLFVVPCVYTILEDFGLTNHVKEELEPVNT